MKARPSEMVKRSDVARFLRQDVAEIERALEMDGMPHTRIPGQTRPGIRIFLPDLHAWLVKRSRLSPMLADFAEFRRAFFAAQPTGKSRGESDPP